MTRTLLRRGRLALAAGLTFAAAGPALADRPCAQWFETACHRYPQPAGVLRPCSCFGYFATQWQPWPCPTPGAAVAAPAAPATEPPTPTTLPPAATPVTPPAPGPLVPLKPLPVPGGLGR